MITEDETAKITELSTKGTEPGGRLLQKNCSGKLARQYPRGLVDFLLNLVVEDSWQRKLREDLRAQFQELVIIVLQPNESRGWSAGKLLYRL